MLPSHRGCYPWLRRLFYEREERGATGEALQIAAGTLEAKALAEGKRHELTDADRRLMKAYITIGLLPHISRPIVLLIGPQGAAKSSTQRLIKRVLDPGRPESIRLDRREVIQKAAHCQVALFDNASGLQGWAIDILCRLVTGEGDSKRRLYTDDEDIIYELKRVVLVNGINPPADRPDFTDRCLPIKLERLDDDKRIPEEKLWAFVQQEHGKWFGALTA